MTTRTVIMADTTKPRLTLPEAVSRKLDKRPDGSIFTRDIKTIYSLMIICLKLQEKPKSKSSGSISLGFLNKQYPFSFSVHEAITTMANLSLNIESSATSTTVSYSIKPDLAVSLLRTFMSAKLIHTPADRTRSVPKDKVLLQPTPKGVAIVQTYCKVNGIKLSSATANPGFTACPSIIRSDFNTMDLFLFERSSITGNIVYSEYFVHLLFTRFLGQTPNVWSPTNPPDEIPTLDHRLQMDDEFDFSNFTNHQFTLTAIQNGVIPGRDQQLVDDKKKLGFSKKTAKRESPFSHSFFTNPDSDSHVQYYVSDKGVRLHQNYKFEGNVTVKYCFSSKSAWQWLMDCTDIMYMSDATNIFYLFYKYGLIEPIILPPSTSTSKKVLTPSKTAFYVPSRRGYDICHWNSGNQTPLTVAFGDEIVTETHGMTLSNEAVIADNQSSSSSEEGSKSDSCRLDLSQITIKTVLSDPGMRYLFRLHLEHEYCAENLDVYMEIRQFSKKMTILRSVMDMQQTTAEANSSKDAAKVKQPSQKVIVRFINECLGLAYRVYSSYIAIGATYQLNIDHRLREKITDAVLHATSPFKARFDDVTRPISIALPQSPEKAHCKESPITSPLDPIPTLSSGPAASVKSPRMINNQNLVIEIPTVDIKPQTASTPTKAEMNKSLTLLHKLYPLFDEVGSQISKMLENDSFPKFLRSETLRGALGVS